MTVGCSRASRARLHLQGTSDFGSHTAQSQGDTIEVVLICSAHFRSLCVGGSSADPLAGLFFYYPATSDSRCAVHESFSLLMPHN